MEAESLVSDGLQPQLYSFCELMGFQLNDPSGREAVSHDNFEIGGENGCNWREREYIQPCIGAG